MDGEWGPWIEHDGRHVPSAPLGRFCEIESISREGDLDVQAGYLPAVLPGAAMVCFLGGGWLLDGSWGKAIVRYRIRRPRGMEVLNSILAEIDQPVEEDT